MADTSAWWDKPTYVFINSHTTVAVTRLGRAVELLLGDWPGKGPAYLKARQAALAAYSNPSDDRAQAKAQRAFEEAAREAEILAETAH
ncbi:DUF982 domain-containing protein [Aquamicrobium terrae]